MSGGLFERRGQHLIEDISLSGASRDQFTLCTCGVTVLVGTFLTLADAWDNHRGAVVQHNVDRAARLATDSEVEEFLLAIDNPDYRPNLGDYQSATVTERDTSTVYYLLERLLEEHWPRDVYACGVCRSLNKYEARKSGQGSWW